MHFDRRRSNQEENTMRLLLALLLPWLQFFTIGRPFAGIICLILQITLIGWLPAAIWSVYALSQYKTDRKIEEALGRRSCVGGRGGARARAADTAKRYRAGGARSPSCVEPRCGEAARGRFLAAARFHREATSRRMTERRRRLRCPAPPRRRLTRCNRPYVTRRSLRVRCRTSDAARRSAPHRAASFHVRLTATTSRRTASRT